MEDFPKVEHFLKVEHLLKQKVFHFEGHALYHIFDLGHLKTSISKVPYMLVIRADIVMSNL